MRDFEAGRRERETQNEVRIAQILGGATFAALSAQLVVRSLPEAPIRPPGRLLAAEAVTLVGCLVILAILRSRPGYRPWRKHAIGAFHLAGIALVVAASRDIGNATLPLLVPVPLLALAIALAGLRYSPPHVVGIGVAAIALHVSSVILEPPSIIKIPATAIGVVMLGAITAAVARAVSSLVALHGEAVAKERLQRFFAPEVVDQIAAAREVGLGAVERDVTVLFSDISGFTHMSSSMTPQEVVDLLNDYFPTMVRIVFQHGGTLEKYIGDALLAVWGAPLPMEDHADRALRAAVDMQQAVEGLNARWRKQGRRPVSIHIGLNSGRVAAGNIGADQYIQYACIGDTTNVSSRVCSVAEAGEIVISESTQRRLRQAPWPREALEPVRVKGKDAPLELYRVDWRERVTPS